ncbi:NUDIX domain-containing protein [Thiomicrorhabdus sp.]|uniref:NUDIX domain-containing protein n=1 Tax=Thiomicrorhabdus sp. TaxID=2039724 RepID=UPI0029C704D4|nr:NUDIX domain-containing protein [Thiomicrorhabdus sp.]
MTDFDNTYLGKLLNHMGEEDFILPAARAVILNQRREVLLIQRSDNQKWGLPAGSIEIGESILDCVIREVQEETGLTVNSATPYALYTEPRFSFINAFGRKHHTFSMSFLITDWSGELVKQTDETLNAKFFKTTELPELVFHYDEVIEDALSFTGEFILK